MASGGADFGCCINTTPVEAERSVIGKIGVGGGVGRSSAPVHFCVGLLTRIGGDGKASKIDVREHDELELEDPDSELVILHEGLFNVSI